MRTMRVLLLITAFAALSLWNVGAKAQDKDRDDQHAAGKATTVTGCLEKGTEPNEFHLTADNGKRYDLRSDEVSLAEHVGHKVTVTGNRMKESKEGKEAEEKGERGEARHNEADERNEAGNLQITKLQMVSDTCK